MEFLVTVDRIEGDTAVLLVAGEAARRLGPGPAKLLWPQSLLPPGAGEGSYIKVLATLDPEAAKAAGARVRSLLDKLSSPPGGPGSEPR